MAMYEYIGVIGHDHCGSTVFARMLGEIDGVECVGEMHWLVDAPSKGEVPMRAGWAVSRRCAVHGDCCPVFTEEFVEQNFTEATLYQSVRNRVGARVIVSTDKYPGLYEKYLAPGVMLGVVLFKHPYAAITSDVLTNRRSFESSMSLWASDYEKILEWSSRFCRDVLWVEYNDFAANHRRIAEMVCKATGINGTRFGDELCSDYHFIGGNAPARGKHVIRVDERWKGFLDDEKIGIINGDKRIQSVLSELLRMKEESCQR